MNLPIIMLAGQMGVGKDTIARILKDKFKFKLCAQADPIKKLGKRFFAFTEDELWGPSENRNKIVPLAGLEWRADQEYTQGGNIAPAQSLRAIAPNSLSGYGTILPAAEALAVSIVELGKGGPGIGLNQATMTCQRFYASLKAFAEEKGGLNARIVLQLLGTEVGRALDKMIWTRATLDKANDMLDTGAPGVVVTDGRFRSEVLAARRAGAKVVLIRAPGVAARGHGGHPSETEILTIQPQFFDLIIENNKEAGEAVLAEYIDDAFYHLFPEATFKSYVSGEPGNLKTVYFVEKSAE